MADIKFNHTYRAAGRTKGWQWQGRERWWEIDVTFHGCSGKGVATIEEWRWNGSAEVVRTQYSSVTSEEAEAIAAGTWDEWRKAVA
jgi:hypothetical protein